MCLVLFFEKSLGEDIMGIDKLTIYSFNGVFFMLLSSNFIHF